MQVEAFRATILQNNKLRTKETFLRFAKKKLHHVLSHSRGNEELCLWRPEKENKFMPKTHCYLKKKEKKKDDVVTLNDSFMSQKTTPTLFTQQPRNLC